MSLFSRPFLESLFFRLTRLLDNQKLLLRLNSRADTSCCHLDVLAFVPVTMFRCFIQLPLLGKTLHALGVVFFSG